MKNYFVISALFQAALMCSVMAAASAPAADSFLEYQKRLSGFEPLTRETQGSIASARKELLKESREKEGISREDYKFLKGTSGRTAAGVAYAHERNILGRDVRILVLEDSGTGEHETLKDWVGAASKGGARKGFTQKVDHGAGMTYLIRSIAPESRALVEHIGELSEAQRSFSAQIINASFGSKIAGDFKKNFGGFAGHDVIIIKSAGNSQEDLSKHPELEGSESLWQQVIFAGNLRPDFRPATSSGVPGENENIQNRFLWTVATDTFSATGPVGSNQVSPISGTSGAAAIISGAAALIKSAHPDFSMDQVSEVLLESADRDITSLFGGHGHNAVYTPDAELATQRAYTKWKKSAPGGTSSLNFAEALAAEGEDNLVAGLIGSGQGVGGISTRQATPLERRQYQTLIEGLIDKGTFDPRKLFAHPSVSAVEDMHRLQLWAMANRYNSGLAPRDDNDSLITTLKLSRYVTDDLINRVLGRPDSGTAAFAAVARPASAAASRAGSSPSSPETRRSLISKPNPTDSFDPTIWGKGVLNIRNALIYAQFMADNPRLAPHEIRRRMLEIINAQEQEAATKIQRAFRGRGHKLTDTELEARPGLTVDLGLEGRKFEEAPGDYPTPPVREISDEEYLRKRGISPFRADDRHASKLKTKGRAKSTGEESSDSRGSSGAAAAASSTRTGMDGIDPELLIGQAPDYLANLARNADELKGESPKMSFISVFNSNIKPEIRGKTPKEAAEKIYELLGSWILSRLNTPLVLITTREDLYGIPTPDKYFYRTPSRAPSLLELLARELEPEVLVELVREVYRRIGSYLTADQKLSVLNALKLKVGYGLHFELIEPVLDVQKGTYIFIYEDTSEVYKDGYNPEKIKYYVREEAFTPLDLLTSSEREDFIIKTDHTAIEIRAIQSYLAKPSYESTIGKGEFFLSIVQSIPWSETPIETLQGVIDSIRRGEIPKTIQKAIRIIEFMGNADEYIAHIFENPSRFDSLAKFEEGDAYFPEDRKEKLVELMALIKQRAGY